MSAQDIFISPEWQRWFQVLVKAVETPRDIAPEQVPDLPYTHIILSGPRLLGRTTAGSGAAELISVAAPLALSAGVLSISGVPSSYVVGDLLQANSATTLSRLADVSVGSYLRSGGVGALVAWSTLKLPNAANSGDILKASSANTYASVAPAALTKTDDTNVTLTLGGTPATSLVNAASLTLGWNGTLAVTRGGTGLGALSTGDLWYGSAANTASRRTIGSTNDVLTVSGGLPVWSAAAAVASSVTIADDTTTNAVMYPTWVTAATGNLPVKVSSTKLTFNPSVATLSLSALGLGTTSTDGFVVQNTTAATGGTPVQISPRIRLAGTAFNSVSGLSEVDGFYLEVVPRTVAGTTKVNLLFKSVINGGAGSDLLLMNSDGSLESNLNIAGEAFWRIGNSHTGTASFASFSVPNAISNFHVYKLGSGFTTGGQYIQNSALIEDDGTAGLSLSASGAGGVIRAYTASTLRLTISAAGLSTFTGSISAVDVSASGLIKGADGSVTNPSWTFTSNTNTGAHYLSSSTIFTAGGSDAGAFTNNSVFGLSLNAGAVLGWVSAGSLTAGQDLTLSRGAADVLEQFRSTNAQRFNLYNTRTSSTNNEYGYLFWSSNVWRIGTSKGSGGGTNRALALYPGDTLSLTANTDGTVGLSAKIATYNNVATAGWGVPAIYGSGRSAAQTAAVASVAAYTCGAADGSFIVSMNVNVTTSTVHNFTAECAYTDETNTARVLTVTFSQLGGAFITAITNVTGAGPYEGVPLHIRAKASTAITLRTQAAGTYTTVTYNVEGLISQAA